jgi:parvulin-like peptidyl-prolyl isomerase
MKRNGIVGDVSYDAFLKQLSDENRNRQEAEAKGKVVFGPKQFGEQDYFDYQMSNNVNKLKEKLFAEAGQVPDADLKARYESDKDKLYKLPDSIRLEAIRISFGDNGTDKEQAERQIGSALKMLGTGEAFETVAERFDPGGKAEALVMDETTARNDELAHPDLKAAADILKPGEISGVIAGNGEFAIIRCVEKVRNRYRPFDEVKPNVRSDYINAKYDEQIDKLVREAKVQIDTGVYDKILP